MGIFGIWKLPHLGVHRYETAVVVFLMVMFMFKILEWSRGVRDDVGVGGWGL